MTVSASEIARLIDQHWGALLIWVGTNDEAAEDIVQQAFVALAAEQNEPENAVGWLYRTSRNMAINEHKKRHRRERRHVKVARPEHEPCRLYETLEANELAEHILTLPPESREIVVARIWGELSFEEIANVTNSSRATVWRRYHAALDILREKYGVTTSGDT